MNEGVDSQLVCIKLQSQTFLTKGQKVSLCSLGSGSFHVDKEGYYLALVDLLASLLESNTMWVNSFLNSNSYFHVQLATFRDIFMKKICSDIIYIIAWNSRWHIYCNTTLEIILTCCGYS